MRYVSSSRRQLVMAALLALAILGAAMRYWAPKPSLARDVGTLLLVMWLPAVGNLIAFLVHQWQVRRPRHAGFDAAKAFSPHLVVRISRPAGAPLPTPGERHCTVVVGHEGFRARTDTALAQLLAGDGEEREVPIELLRPELALPRLGAGTRVQLLSGQAAVAHGTVVAYP